MSFDESLMHENEQGVSSKFRTTLILRRYATCKKKRDFVSLNKKLPEISRFYGIIIWMYFQDHNPPHFHAEYQGMKAEYDVRTLNILAGRLPKRANALVLE